VAYVQPNDAMESAWRGRTPEPGRAGYSHV